jgi:hypothetical protein
VAVQVWVGEKPEHSNERRVIMALASALDRLDGLYLALANFSVGGRTVDLVIIKSDAIFIIELKHCDGRVFGDVNGPWFIEDVNGERKRINPGRKNPYNQVISYYYSLINFLNERRPQFLSSHKASSVDFRTCQRLVVIAPTIQAGSVINTDWKVGVLGLDQLPAYLVTERSTEIELRDDEMLAIPELLNCTRWSEINTLLQPAVPVLEVAPPPDAPPAVEPAMPAAEVAPPAAPRWPALTPRWRIGAVVALIVAMIVGWNALRPAAPVPVDAPALVVSTSLPAGGIDPIASQGCVWSGFQAIGRSRDDAGIWRDVGDAGGVIADAMVIISLDEVSFCDGMITLRWSLRNRSTDEVLSLPLTSESVSIRDSLGNTYVVQETAGAPLLTVPPGMFGAATATVGRAIDPNASTLVVTLHDAPFGAATWLVPVAPQAGRG